MTSLDSAICHGSAYYPPILKEQEGMKKFAREALVDRLLKFNFFPNDSLFIKTRGIYTKRSFEEIDLTKSAVPDINNKLSSAVKRWLSQLVATPTGFALYDFIANSDARIEVCRGEQSYLYKTDDGLLRIVITEEYIDEDGAKTAQKTKIAQRSTGVLCLFSFPPVSAFGHESIHARHWIQGINDENREKVYGKEDLYFPNAEEMLTIMGYANYGTQRLIDPICENAINLELGFPARVSHKLPRKDAAFLGIDGEMQEIIAQRRHSKENYFRSAIDGASRKNQSFQGNQLKVIQMLIDAGCKSTHIYESIDFLLSNSASHKVAAKILKMFPIEIFHFKAKILKIFHPDIFCDMIQDKPLAFDFFPIWIRVINAAGGPQAVKALLQYKPQDVTPFQLAREVRAEELVFYLEDLEKESRYRYPVFDRGDL